MGDHRQHHLAADTWAHNAVPRFIAPTNRVGPYGPYVSTARTRKFGLGSGHLINIVQTCFYAQTLWHDYSRVPDSSPRRRPPDTDRVPDNSRVPDSDWIHTPNTSMSVWRLI